MKAQFKSSYPKNGGRVFVFRVLGTEDEKIAYLEAQAAAAKARGAKEPVTDEDGTPLYWSTSPTGKTITLGITDKGIIYEDTSELALNASAQANADFAYNSVMQGLKARAGQGMPRVNVNTGAEKID